MAILAIVVVPGFVIPTQKVGKVRQQLQAEIQQWLSAMTVQLSETLGISGALLIRIFNRESAEEKKFTAANNKLRDLQDKIIVLEKGNIIASGTHPELVETNPLYKKLYETQFDIAQQA
jgi:ABC-type multidrug transport system fused ATPase/permease subunit